MPCKVKEKICLLPALRVRQSRQLTPERLTFQTRLCLVPRPHYYARPMCFGSRGPRMFLRPRQTRRSETFWALSIQRKFRFEISETSRCSMERYIPVAKMHKQKVTKLGDPTQATARFVIVASQHTHNYALKEKSKYCLYPKEHSTVEKGRWKTKGGGILFRVESL